MILISISRCVSVDTTPSSNHTGHHRKSQFIHRPHSLCRHFDTNFLDVQHQPFKDRFCWYQMNPKEKKRKNTFRGHNFSCRDKVWYYLYECLFLDGPQHRMQRAREEKIVWTINAPNALTKEKQTNIKPINFGSPGDKNVPRNASPTTPISTSFRLFYFILFVVVFSLLLFCLNFRWHRLWAVATLK